MSDISRTPKSVRSSMYKGGGGGGGGTNAYQEPMIRVDENIRVSDLNEGNQHKFLGAA